MPISLLRSHIYIPLIVCRCGAIEGIAVVCDAVWIFEMICEDNIAAVLEAG